MVFGSELYAHRNKDVLSVDPNDSLHGVCVCKGFLKCVDSGSFKV